MEDETSVVPIKSFVGCKSKRYTLLIKKEIMIN